MVTPFAKTAIIAVAASVLAAGTASAQNPVVQEQRKDQVQDRVQDTNQRINQEYREGNITRNEARELKQENREIAHDAREQAQRRGGPVARRAARHQSAAELAEPRDHPPVAAVEDPP